MPCITVQFEPARGPIINLGFAKPSSLEDSKDQVEDITLVGALVDTGASVTCLSRRVAEGIGLPIMGKKPLMSATHTVPANVYLADLALPFGEPGEAVATFFARDCQVMEFQTQNPNFQALLGRDILYRGLFQMAGYDRRFTFCL